MNGVISMIPLLCSLARTHIRSEKPSPLPLNALLRLMESLIPVIYFETMIWAVSPHMMSVNVRAAGTKYTKNWHPCHRRRSVPRQERNEAFNFRLIRASFYPFRNGNEDMVNKKDYGELDLEQKPAGWRDIVSGFFSSLISWFLNGRSELGSRRES